MKTFKRILSLLLALTMLFVFAGCGDDGEKEASKSKFSKEGRDITLYFAAWFNRDLQQHLADAFMETHSDVYVELVEIDQNSWSSGLQNLASTGDLPDAFCTFDLATATANGWTADITEYYDADPTTAKISEGLKVAGVYNGKRYGLVTEQYPCLVLINKTLFDDNDIAMPGYDWTIDEMYSLATKLTKPNEHQYGLGDNVLSYLRDVYNAAYTTDTWQYGYDPDKGVFDTKYLAQGYSKGLELINNKIAGVVSAEDMEAWYGDPDIWLPKTGKQAMQLDWYWTIQTVKAKEYVDLGQEWVAYPFPVGTSGRVQTIVNVGCVSETSDHPELAYELLKFMTFGEDGWKSRYEWYKGNNELPASVPIVKDDAVLDLVKELTPGDDYAAVYDSIDRSVADIKKWVPGLTNYESWMSSQELWAKLRNSSMKVEDVAADMEQKLNYYYTECMNKIKARG
ncbi:MAG: extracellular solute-binding protein [Ruminococcaceae bacterium]|nr:extracellular solute-binding protein [Oscillospiraceae bacterium]